MARLVRGCGTRKVGGMYLVGEGYAVPCGKLPLPVPERCPVCGEGVKRSRGLQFVNTRLLGLTHSACGSSHCFTCPLGGALPDRVGLMWIGEKFYPTPASFIVEAVRFGVSKRIAKLPRDLKLGETWVYLVHPRGIVSEAELFKLLAEGVTPLESGVREYVPAVVYVFKPQRVEKVVRKGSLTINALDQLLKRGITPVEVEADAEGNAIEEEPHREVNPENVNDPDLPQPEGALL